jgi:hypothetical protein
MRDCALTESLSEEKIIIPAEVAGTTLSNEKIVERSTIVQETRIESTVIESIGEKIKTQLFTKFKLMKPRAEEIQLISIDKYYEPYLKISGKYVIDYYRKCTYRINVDNNVQEVILSNQKYKPNQQTDPSAKDSCIIKLQGEERLATETKVSLILDRFGQEVSPRELPSTPPERNPKEILAALGIRELASSFDLDLIRSKIYKRPKDISRLVNELFEVNERAIIYTPRFRVQYTNLRTGEGKAIEIDGITAQRIDRPHPQPRFLP